MKPDYEILAFESQNIFRIWLKKHHNSEQGIWLKMYKKASGVPTVSYAQALDEALCFGWIDGQSKKYDEQAYIQKFTPRRKASMWSKRNIQHVARLTEAGKMTQAGQAEIDRAKSDGRWDAAYDAPSEMVAPEYFTTLLKQNPKAEAFYMTLN